MRRVIRREAGFTLIEIVISLLIFAMLSLMAWQGLYQVVQVEERSRAQSVEQNAINLAWAVLVQDLLHLRSRPVRDQFGDLQPAYSTDVEPYQVIFSRGGLPPLGGVMPLGMQRVAYWVSDAGDLTRRTWPLADGYRADQGRDQILLSGVQDLLFEQLDAGNYYQVNWPPLNEQLDPRELPRMMRLTLTLNNGLAMTRVVPGIQAVVPDNRQQGDDS